MLTYIFIFLFGLCTLIYINIHKYTNKALYLLQVSNKAYLNYSSTVHLEYSTFTRKKAWNLVIVLTYLLQILQNPYSSC